MQTKVRSYLKRIGYSGPVHPTFKVLANLHRQHLLTTPFENLDIHMGRRIRLDQKLFFRKIVEGRRGGYCYELNGCFAWLLKNLGFRVSMLSARVARKDGGFSPEFDHMTLVVRLKEHWLADVGFGDLFTEPKSLETATPQKEGDMLFRITVENGARLLSRKNDERSPWEPQYAFRLRPHKLADFAARNRYQQTSPRSHFANGRIISQLTRFGRISLTDKKFIRTVGRKRTEHHVKNKVEFEKLLKKYFGYALDSI